ncbi:ShlB/FhaC/HecB family hemolysin secretion/activation protein [Pararobbsia alpina]|uniref:ShlB/FhaC/HecB family hemolysin secretion/activation protein n=1 Tax=Pararobbsia alpina TaxID=621374 RepID=UPI0039A58408
MKNAQILSPIVAALGVITLGAASPAFAQATRAPVGGNPVQTLPQMNAPQPAPNVTVQVEKPNPQLEQLLARKITPSKVQVEGVKALPFNEVAQRFTPLVGHETTIGQLIETANGVTKLYQDRGYALSFAFIPAQDFADGVVRVTVVEGYVSKVQISGDAGNAEAKIRAIAAHIEADRPLRRSTFERYINVLGLMQGVKIAANVAPPTTTDGGTTLDLKVERKRFDFNVGTDFNHPGVQALATAVENGVLGLGEQLSVSALFPPGRDDQTYFAANFSAPLGSDGLLGKLNASHYHGEPTDNPGLPSSVHRDVTQDKFGGAIAYPFLLSNQRSLVGQLSAYATHDEDRYTNTITGAELGLKSNVRVLSPELDYVDTSDGQTRKASVSISKAFNILGASKSAFSNVAGAAPQNQVDIQFFKANASYTQSNTWPYGFGTTFSLAGQYSADSLPTSEQITFGGPRFGLGYEPGEAAGDSGWGASIELNRQFNLGYTYLQTVQPYLEFDTARVYLHSGPTYPNHLASVAIGVRFGDLKHYSLDLALGKAVGDAPVESASRSPRVNANFSYNFQ